MSEYTNQTLLGTGGMGQVYVCQKGGLEYAKKMLLPGSTPEAVERFRREVRILSKLRHANVVQVLEFNVTQPPHFYYVMPLYRSSLEDQLQDIAKNPDRVKTLFRAILTGVIFAHGQGVLHRDLKPGNILWNSDHDVAVSDFGLGRMLDAETTRQTMSNVGMGTFFFTAPEQLQNAKSATAASDVFSLGRILYALHTGPVKSLKADPSKLPADVRFLFTKCDHDEPSQRFQTVEELAQAWEVSVEGDRLGPSASERIDALLKLIAASSSPEDYSRLADELLLSVDDGTLVHQTVMILSPDQLTEMVQSNLAAMRTIVRRFCDHTAEASFDWAYTDGVAKQCRALFNAVDDYEMKADLVFCVGMVGYNHDRFKVYDHFVAMLTSGGKPGEALALIERLKQMPRPALQRLAGKVQPSKLNAFVLGYLRRSGVLQPAVAAGAKPSTTDESDEEWWSREGHDQMLFEEEEEKHLRALQQAEEEGWEYNSDLEEFIDRHGGRRNRAGDVL